MPILLVSSCPVVLEDETAMTHDKQARGIAVIFCMAAAVGMSALAETVPESLDAAALAGDWTLERGINFN